MEILALTGLFHPERMDEIKQKSQGSIQFAADILQKLIIKGLNKNEEIYISICNSLFVSSFPVFKDLYIKEVVFESKDNVSFIDTAFLNISILKLFYKEIVLKRHLKKWLKGCSQQNKVIVIYAVYSPFLSAAVYAKTIDPSIKLCLIAPDLPDYMSDNTSVIYRFLKFVEKKRNIKYLKKIDGCVGLTDYMKEPLGFADKPFLRIEGIVDSENIEGNIDTINTVRKKIVLYSGTLANRYGITRLVDAFMNLTIYDAELWIVGSGDSENYIASKSKIDNRIKMLGQKQHKEVKLLQRSATVLVNPRINEGEYTKYSFPSKTMEYLASGTPTILYKLPGIPNEYYTYCFALEDTSISALTNEIERLLMLSLDELNLIGNRARQFVISTKNEKIQGNRLFNFLKTL